MPVERTIGDTLSPLRVQIKKNNVPVNLTGRAVHFAMYDNDGVEIIARSATGVSTPDDVNGIAEYDFQSQAIPSHSDVIAYPDGRPYYAYFYIFDGDPGVESEAYPPKGLQILFFSPQRDQQVPVTSIDIAAAAATPKRARTEEGSVEERTIDELIKADQYLKAQTAPDAVPWGIRVARVQYGSTTPGAGSQR